MNVINTLYKKPKLSIIEIKIKTIFGLCLLTSARLRSLDYIKYFIKLGADPNFKYDKEKHKKYLDKKKFYQVFEDGQTPLLELCNVLLTEDITENDYKCVEALIKNGANPSLKNKNKHNSLEILKDIDYEDMSEHSLTILNKIIQLLNTTMHGRTLIPLLSKRSKHKKIKLGHDVVRLVHEALSPVSL
jgi:hypothetical protein